MLREKLAARSSRKSIFASAKKFLQNINIGQRGTQGLPIVPGGGPVGELNPEGVKGNLARGQGVWGGKPTGASIMEWFGFDNESNRKVGCL